MTSLSSILRTVCGAVITGVLLASCANSESRPAETSVATSSVTSSSTATSPTELPYNVETIKYADEHERQHGFFLTPKNVTPEQKIPLVIFIHGGGWLEKSKAQSAAPNVNDLVKHGVAVWNIEYRGVSLDGKDSPGGWPTTYEDVAAAIDYVPILAENSPVALDLDKVVVAGYSAGGNLSTWACSRTALRDKAPGANPKFPVHNCVGMAGVYDMELAYVQHDKYVKTLLGGTPQEVPDHYSDASPADNVNKEAHVVVLHGKNDHIVKADEVTLFLEKAKGSGMNIDSTILDDANHISWTKVDGPQWKLARKTILEHVGISI